MQPEPIALGFNRYGPGAAVRSLPASTARARPAASRLDTGAVLVAWVFIGCWLLFTFVDTIWSDAVEGLTRARVMVPCVLLAIVVLEQKPRSPPGQMRFGIWLCLIACAAVLSSFSSAAPMLSYIKLALYLGVLAPILLSSSLRRAFDPSQPGLWHLTLVAAGMLLASAIWFPTTSTGIYNNANKLAASAVCVWPLLAYHTRHHRRFRKIIGWLGLAACCAACVLTLSRGGMMGLATGLVAYVAVRCSPTVKSLVIGFLALAMISLTTVLLSDQVRHLAYKDRETLIAPGRILVIQQALEAWSHRPLFGYGFGLSWASDREDQQLVLEAGRMSWFTTEFGSSTMAMLSGGGMVITVLFYGLIGTVMFRCFRSLRDPEMDHDRRELQLALFGGLTGMLAHAQAEAWLMAPLTWSTLLFWLYIALAAHLSAPVNRRQPVAVRSHNGG